MHLFFALNLVFSTLLIFGRGLALAAPAPALSTIEQVKKRGVLNCGVNQSLMGFSYKDAQGNWAGFDVEYCRALAAAVLGNGQKVKFIPLSLQNRFEALKKGQVDVLARNTTWSLNRDTERGIAFVGALFYDGQGFLVRSDLKIERLYDLDGATICVQNKTTSSPNLDDYFKQKSLTYTPVRLDTFEEAMDAFFKGRCDAFSADVTALAAVRTVYSKDPTQYQLLREVISKEPLGPAVRKDDWDWFIVARWTLFALIEAEELGVKRIDVLKMRENSLNPEVQRFLGKVPGLGRGLGLSDAWAFHVIQAVGNYGEIYERSVGFQSLLKLDRTFNEGLNLLWTEGGLHYSPPFQ